MANELIVLFQGKRMGFLTSGRRIQLTFKYSEEWLSEPAPVPLSLSMPVLPQGYSGETLENWLWGLLPDDPVTLRRLAAQYHVSPSNLFALLSEFGEDVAGAVQFVTPEREEQAISGGDIRWLTESEFEERLVALQKDAANTRRMDDPGRFSLAGAQAKMALLAQDGQWGVPSGRIPTNRIVKLASGMYDGLIENEHFCIELVKAVGLNAVRSRVIDRAGVKAIVVDRYDRVKSEAGGLVRVHQEDMCQANGVSPQSRYENEGGLGVGAILETLNASSQPVEDRERFVRAQIVNFLLGGTDAHAKNFSVLLGAQADVRLAPLYDMASLFPYQDFRRCKLAMRIGNSYDFDSTLPRHWAALGRRLGGNSSRPVDWLEEYASVIPTKLIEVADEVTKSGIDHEVIEKLEKAIRASCGRALQQVQHYRKVK